MDTKAMKRLAQVQEQLQEMYTESYSPAFVVPPKAQKQYAAKWDALHEEESRLKAQIN